MLLRDERFCLRGTEGSSVDLAGRISGREIGEEFAAVVVEAAAASNDEFRVKGGWLPGNAQARGDPTGGQ